MKGSSREEKRSHLEGQGGVAKRRTAAVSTNREKSISLIQRWVEGDGHAEDRDLRGGGILKRGA